MGKIYLLEETWITLLEKIVRDVKGPVEAMSIKKRMSQELLF